VVVAELLPEIVRWNHEHLDGLNDEILADPRTEIVRDDVFKLINRAAQKGSKFDAILLDVDDGPTSLIQPQNIQLYGLDGLDMLKKALTPGGRLAIWAAVAEPKLLNALGRAGFRTEEIACAKHARAKRQNHRIYLAERKD
jgi:spermidine synthase